MTPFQCGTYSKDAHASSWQSIAQALETSAEGGLSDDEANQCLQQCGHNRLRKAKPRSAIGILIEQFKSILVALLGVAAALSLVFGDRNHSKGLRSNHLQDIHRNIIVFRVAKLSKTPGFMQGSSFYTTQLYFYWHIYNLGETDLFMNENVKDAYIWGALALCIYLLAGAVYLPGLAKILKITDPGWRGWLLVIGMSLLPWAAGQLINSTGLQNRIILRR